MGERKEVVEKKEDDLRKKGSVKMKWFAICWTVAPDYVTSRLVLARLFPIALHLQCLVVDIIVQSLRCRWR